jgi:CHRD domain
MRCREGIRKIAWAATCLVFTSSALVLAGPASAATYEGGPTTYGGDPTYNSFRHFAVYLSGNELGDGGDHNGWGMARIDLDADHETACYVVDWDRLDGSVTAFHLHNAPRHHDGPHWIDFFNEQHFSGEKNSRSGCVHSTREKILDVFNYPYDYYFALHTTTHKDGAIRGQMF